MASGLPLCSSRCWRLDLKPPPPPPIPCGGCRGDGGFGSYRRRGHRLVTMSGRSRGFFLGRRFLIKGPVSSHARKSSGGDASERQRAWDEGRPVRRAQQAALWATEAAYILWLFLLPYAPGDPVWAIKSETINDLVGLSLNFFFILPLLNTEVGKVIAMYSDKPLLSPISFPTNLTLRGVKKGYPVFNPISIAGIHVIGAPVLHPMSEGLFNFVIAWTLLFAPLLFTDRRRDRFGGSLDLLWGFQMFLTNTLLIPYMAIRLDDVDAKRSPREPSPLGSLMTSGASVVGLIGGAVCLISILWAFFGRIDGGFGGFADRCDYLVRYLGSERLAYAFICDIVLYAIFQPWLIGDNLLNVKKSNVVVVSNLRFIPVVGLVAYLLCLDDDKEL